MKESFRNDLKNIQAVNINVPKCDIMMSLNESYFNPWDILKQEIINTINDIPFNRYFNDITMKLKIELCNYVGNGISSDNIIMGNGADELLYYLFTAVRNNLNDKILTFHPSYFDYITYSAAVGLGAEKILLNDDFSFPIDKFIEKMQNKDIKLAILCNPNNPTGNLFSHDDIISILEKSKQLVLIDEAYFEFSDITMIKLINKYSNLLILRSFSKGFSSAGLRFGYMIGNKEIIKELKKVITAFNLSLITQGIAYTILRNKEIFLKINDIIKKEREKTYNEMKEIEGIKVFPSKTNFLLFRVLGEDNAHIKIHENLYKNNISIRNVSNDNVLKNCLRVTIDKPENNEIFVNFLKNKKNYI